MDIESLYNLYLQHPSIQTDTRKLKKGDLFFALKGPSFNGNSFASQALDAGATYAIIDEPEYQQGAETILVNDVLSTLQELALFHRSRLSIPFIAITGSNGKTTTKELVHAVLSTRFRTYTTEGNLNNHIGVPLTILKIREDAEMAVIEMGANHQQEIAGYCRYTLPDFGLITNVGKAHLEGFGGEEGVKKGKGELFDHLRSNNGTAFLFTDSDTLKEMSTGIRNIYTYGTSEGDVTGTVEKAQPFLSVAFSKGLTGTVSTQLVGDYNLPNILAAAAVGVYFNIPGEKIRQALENYQPTNSRSQLVKKGSNRIVLDAYNANPSSMSLAIENFARAEGDNKILVLGAMAELGTSSLEEHEQIVKKIGQYPWKEVVLVGGDFEKIQHPYKQFSRSADAGAWIGKQDIRNAFLLVKGSRSMQMEKVLDYLDASL